MRTWQPMHQLFSEQNHSYKGINTIRSELPMQMKMHRRFRSSRRKIHGIPMESGIRNLTKKALSAGESYQHGILWSLTSKVKDTKPPNTRHQCNGFVLLIIQHIQIHGVGDCIIMDRQQQVLCVGMHLHCLSRSFN